ncbi:hypothetical protein STEG23_005364 [Scotinomys teguina]
MGPDNWSKKPRDHLFNHKLKKCNDFIHLIMDGEQILSLSFGTSPHVQEAACWLNTILSNVCSTFSLSIYLLAILRLNCVPGSMDMQVALWHVDLESLGAHTKEWYIWIDCPQSSGKVERMNRSLKSILTKNFTSTGSILWNFTDHSLPQPCDNLCTPLIHIGDQVLLSPPGQRPSPLSPKWQGPFKKNPCSYSVTQTGPCSLKLQRTPGPTTLSSAPEKDQREKFHLDRSALRTNEDDGSWTTEDCSITLGLHTILDSPSGRSTYLGGHSPLTP